MLETLVVLLGYLSGSLPFGLIAGRLKGIDIRLHGSRNIGATNVGRVLGKKWGLGVFLLDFLKGLLPALVLPPLLLGQVDHVEHVRVATGIAAILGHMFPAWLGFRGGKGVATSFGVVCCLAPMATVVAAGLFVLTFFSYRIVSLGSILASIGFAAAALYWLSPNPFREQTWSLAAFALGVPLLIIVQHRANIARLLKGEEPQYRSAAERARPQ